MKQINLNKMIIENNLQNERRILGMEFIKRDDGNYIVKDSGLVVDEKEKLRMERNELVFKDISAPCAKNITKELSKKQKRIEELDEDIEEAEPITE